MDEGTPSRAPADQLERALRNLIAAGTGQQVLFADRATTADALARDFEHWATVVRATGEAELTPAQEEALAAIGRAFATMSRDEAEFDAELWTPAAMATSRGWIEVRALAARALEAFGRRAGAGASAGDAETTAAAPE